MPIVWLVRRARSARLLGMPLGVAAILIAVGLAAVPAHARFTQQDKLVGSGGIGDPEQGTSVALSADGNTAIVGGMGDNCCVGAAWVFIRSNGVWMQQGEKLVGRGAVGPSRQGFSVALSVDGNTAIVGGPDDDGGVGAAWIFTRKGAVWRQQGEKLVGTGAIGAAGQGGSVALSADGNTAVIGGSFDDGDIGAAWVFTRSNGVWTQQGTKLVGTGAVGPAGQGVSVALSGDGNTAVFGGPLDDGEAGAVWVFTHSGGTWTQQGSKLVGGGANGSARQGTSVALSGDGNTAIFGGMGDDCCVGAAWVFTRSGAVWTQQGGKLVGSGAIGGALQGAAVGLSADGNTAVVGGPGHNFFVGSAWIYVRKRGVWQQGGRMHGTKGGVAAQGTSVALSGDGDTAIVGGPFTSNFTGAAWVFGRPGITAISPAAGTVDGGTGVTIVGRNFADVTGVLFGGVPATNVIAVNANTVLATTPAHAATTVNVIVTTRTGASRAFDAYTYERHDTATFLTSSANPSSPGQLVRFTASVTTDGAVAGGRVRFTNGDQTLGIVDVRNGVAKFATSDLPAGVHTIRAFYLANGNYSGSFGGLRQRVED